MTWMEWYNSLAKPISVNVLREARRRAMASFIGKPTIIVAAGQPPKLIEEFIGRVNSGSLLHSVVVCGIGSTTSSSGG